MPRWGLTIIYRRIKVLISEVADILKMQISNQFSDMTKISNLADFLWSDFLNQMYIRTYVTC